MSLGQLLGVSGQMRGFGVDHFRSVDHLSVVAERCWWTVVLAVVSGVNRFVTPVSAAEAPAAKAAKASAAEAPGAKAPGAKAPGVTDVASVLRISRVSRMRRFGGLRGVRYQMRFLGVSYFRRVHHLAVMGQRGWWSMIVSDVRVMKHLGRVTRQSQCRQQEARQDGLKERTERFNRVPR